MTESEIVLGGGPDAVPRARRFVADTLRRWGYAELSDDIGLAATELVTNGLLHAGPPLRLVLRTINAHAVRIEVHDPSRVAPVRARRSDGMTGRGLALVEALASRWGVEPTATGKVVWAELSADSITTLAPASGDVDALLAGFADLADGRRQRYVVTLGDVPTDLLLGAKTHVDSLSREFTLAATGAVTGLTAEIPPHVVDLVHAVVNEFAEARGSIKRQALAAANAGSPRTTLTLALPIEAADAGERYLAALEEADAYARSARLLTLEAPAQHRAFRRWYVTSLVDSLRRAAAGEPVTQPPTFEAYLLGEVDHLEKLQRASERAARLQRITAALAGAIEVDQVGAILLSEAVAELRAVRGSLVVPDGDQVRVAVTTGYPAALRRRLAEVASHEPLPAIEALRTGEPVWIEDAFERDARAPALARLEPDCVATCAVPLALGNRLLGAFRISFADIRLFDDNERGFLTALGTLGAQALERAELYAEQTRLADRLSRVQQVTAALAGSRDLAHVIDVTVEQATGLLGAQICALCLLAPDGHTLEVVRVRASVPIDDVVHRCFDIADDLPAAEAVRTGRVVASASLAERDARWPAMRGLPPLDDHAVVALPLPVRQGVIGSLTLSFTGMGQIPEADHVALAALANACAQALDRARSAERAARATRRLTFLARASAQLADPLDVQRTMSEISRLAVPELADWCLVHVLTDGALRPLVVEHEDRARAERALDGLRRAPRLSDTRGLGAVARTGRSLIVPVVVDEPDDADGSDLLATLGLTSVIVTPLIARGDVLGALTLGYAESGRRYEPDDLTLAEDLARRAALAIEKAPDFDDAGFVD
jgi:GAF domain-containing protein